MRLIPYSRISISISRSVLATVIALAVVARFGRNADAVDPPTWCDEHPCDLDCDPWCNPQCAGGVACGPRCCQSDCVDEYGVAFCVDPPCTFFGEMVRLKISFGSQYSGDCSQLSWDSDPWVHVGCYEPYCDSSERDEVCEQVFGVVPGPYKRLCRCAYDPNATLAGVTLTYWFSACEPGYVRPWWTDCAPWRTWSSNDIPFYDPWVNVGLAERPPPGPPPYYLGLDDNFDEQKAEPDYADEDVHRANGTYIGPTNTATVFYEGICEGARLSSTGGSVRLYAAWPYPENRAEVLRENTDITKLPAGFGLYVEGIEPGGTTVKLNTWDAAGRSRDRTRAVQVVQMDIDLPDLEDNMEARPPGRGIGLNDDDDDHDGISDLADTSVVGEDDLVAMQVTSRGVDCPYRYRFSFGANVAIWRSTAKDGTPLGSGELLTPLDHPSTLYVEAVSSGIGVITGELLIDPEEDGSWQSVHSDQVTYIACQVDLVATTVEPFGLLLSSNWSDNDGDGWTDAESPPDAVYTPDKDDDHITQAAGDPDLRCVIVWATPTDLEDSAIRISVSGGVKAYRDPTKKMGAESSQVASGTEIPLSEFPLLLYIEGVSGSPTFASEKILAEYLWHGDSIIQKELPATVFEVGLAGLFSGPQQADNQLRFNSEDWQLSDDRNGLISWNDANGDGETGDNDPHCHYFHNCMECQGKVIPPLSLVDPPPVQFAFLLEVRKLHAESQDGSLWVYDPAGVTTWTDDGPADYVQDTSISGQEHIYTIDAPGPIDLEGSHLMVYSNFRVKVMVEIDGSWHQCSDYFKWHSQMLIVPVPGTGFRTRGARSAQKLNSGWIAFPE